MPLSVSQEGKVMDTQRWQDSDTKQAFVPFVKRKGQLVPEGHL